MKKTLKISILFKIYIVLWSPYNLRPIFVSGFSGGEGVILDSVCGWLENHQGASTETIWDILKCVRYNQLTEKEITEFSDRVFQGMPDQRKGKNL